jgi:hypothetical protein
MDRSRSSGTPVRPTSPLYLNVAPQLSCAEKSGFSPDSQFAHAAGTVRTPGSPRADARAPAREPQAPRGRTRPSAAKPAGGVPGWTPGGSRPTGLPLWMRADRTTVCHAGACSLAPGPPRIGGQHPQAMAACTCGPASLQRRLFSFPSGNGPPDRSETGMDPFDWNVRRPLSCLRSQLRSIVLRQTLARQTRGLTGVADRGSHRHRGGASRGCGWWCRPTFLASA